MVNFDQLKTGILVRSGRKWTKPLGVEVLMVSVGRWAF